jgi:hypothetical protein
LLGGERFAGIECRLLFLTADDQSESAYTSGRQILPAGRPHRIFERTSQAPAARPRQRGLNTVAEQEPQRNHDAVKLIGWIALGYAWRIAGSLLQILFVLYIFSRLEDRFDTIVVAISGLIYASILSIDLYFIHNRIGDDVSDEQEDRAVESKKPHAMFLAAIPGFGFFVIGLVCLYHLLNAL